MIFWVTKAFIKLGVILIPPKIGRVNVGVFPHYPTYLGLFECFSTITQHIKDNVVIEGFVKTTKFVVNSLFFIDFLSYESIYWAGGHFDFPMVGTVTFGVFLINPTYIGLFECFSTITHQLKDYAVKTGVFKDRKFCSCLFVLFFSIFWVTKAFIDLVVILTPFPPR